MKNIYLLVILLLAAACNSEQQNNSKSLDYAGSEEAPPPPAAILDVEENTGSNINRTTVAFTDASTSHATAVSTQHSVNQNTPVPKPEIQKKLIKNGSLRMQVEDYAQTRPRINQLIAGHNGYISSENESNTGNTIQNNITIRIPFNQYDALVSQLEKEASYVESKTVNVQDVTAQFVDIEGRLKTRREVEARYMDFLKRAKNIDETLKIEEQIRQLREEIESAEGQLKLMRDQVMYSTLQLYVYQNLPYKVTPPTETGFFAKLGEAFANGWRMMLGFIVGVTYLWPFIIAGLIVFFVFRRRLG